MKIVSLNSSVSRRNGGVFEVSRRLAQELERMESESVHVLGLEDEGFAADASSWEPLKPRVFTPRFPKAYGYAPGFTRELESIRPDICHVHGLWMYPTFAARRWAQRSGCPYLVTIHGMLDPWALRNSGWKKRIVGALTERKNLEGAACLHAITPAEIVDIRSFGLPTPVCLIPNGVDLPDDRHSLPDPPPWPRSSPEEKVLLYLGRVHPKKGLLPLLDAWDLLRREPCNAHWDWRLVIAGWDQGGHEAELKMRVKTLGLEAFVHFAGPLFGKAKDAAYRCAEAFILPSFSEGLPLVVLEAWSHRLPVLMTTACNLPQGFAAGAAFRIESEPASIASAFATLQALPRGSIQAMGHAGRKLVEKSFSWSKVAGEMRLVYQWLAGIGNPPESLAS